MIPALTLADHQFDRLAAGGGDAAAIGVLLRGQFSKNVLLIQAVLDLARQTWDKPAAASLMAAYALLARVQRDRPARTSACGPRRACTAGTAPARAKHDTATCRGWPPRAPAEPDGGRMLVTRRARPRPALAIPTCCGPVPMA